MCGIVALFFSQMPIDAGVLERATQQLHHRGPDQQKCWVHPSGLVGLGHARLSIIDLDTGDQPIANEDGRLRVVVNGEFYGYEKIREDLEARGHYFRTSSDSEIVLHLYEEMGVNCLEHLRGEFAFVLWDETNQLLFAARDRFGIKPLFYAPSQDKLLLASEVKALFAAGVPAAWDREAMFQHLSICMDQDRTLFHNVLQVPPAHYLLASRYHTQLIRYWDLDYPHAPIQQLREEEYVEKLRYVLEESVRLRLRADVPVGCFLSGGIDSSTILGMAAQQRPQGLAAFTTGFDSEAYDESPVAARMAQAVGVPHHILSINQNDFAEHISDVVWHGEMLGHNAHAIARYLQSRAVHEAGYKVVLSGDGADEVFAGYLYSHLDYLTSNPECINEKQKNEHIEEISRTNPAFREVLRLNLNGAQLAGVKRTIGSVPTWLRAMSISRGVFLDLFSPVFLQEFARRDPYHVFLSKFDVPGQLKGRDPVLQALYLWTRSFLPNQVLFADRMEMAHSVEVRMPFLDHHVFEVMREIPVKLLIAHNQQKYMLREVARPYVPAEIYGRPKHNFTAPHTTLDPKSSMYGLVQDTLRSTTILSALPFFDQKAVVDLLDRIPTLPYRQRIALDQIVFMLLGVCLLQKAYAVRSA